MTRCDQNLPVFPRRRCVLSLCVLLVCGAAAREGPAGGRTELARADSLRETGRYEAALGAYIEAHSRGLPKDSLFYFWARIYIDRGIYDSALAVNRAALDMKRAELRRPLLAQRYVVYSLAGAEERASAVRERMTAASPDTATAPPRPVRPYLRARASSGYEGARERKSSLLTDSVHDAGVHEMRTALSLDPGIRIEAGGPAPDRLGAYLRLKDRRHLGDERSGHGADSLSIAGGLTTSWSNLLDMFSFGLEGGVLRDRYHSTLWTGGVSLSAIGTSLLGVASYSFALTKQGKLDNQIGYLAGILNKPLSSRLTLSPGLSAMVYGAEAMELILPVYALHESGTIEAKMLYIDEGATSGELVPRFYGDPELTAPLDTTGANGSLPGKALYLRRAAGRARAASIRLTIPVTFVRLGASVEASMGLTESVRLKPSLGVWGDWYPELVRWTTIDMEAATPYMAYQPAAQTYYAIEGMDGSGYDVGADPLAIGDAVGYEHAERRRDLRVVLGCMLEKRFAKAGTLGLDTRWRLYATSMSEAAPVTTTLNDMTVGLVWRYDWKTR